MEGHKIEIAWQGPPQCQNCGIRHLVLFADLQHGDFKLIHRPIEELDFEVGGLLYKMGEAPDYVFTVRKGLVKLTHYLPDGTQRIVRLLKQGDLAGMEALTEQPYQQDAIVLEPLSVCRIPVSVIERLSRETPRLYHQLMMRWQRAINEANSWLTELSTGPARVRVARLLVQLANCCSADIAHLPSREDIGAMLGVTTETTSRIIAEYKRKGYIEELDNNRAKVDIDSLQTIAMN